MTKNKKEATTTNTNPQLFGKGNYMWMIIGVILLAAGFFLMAGGKSTDPNVFNSDEVYSTMRITVAPILVIAGFVVEIFAIMKKSKAE